MWSLAARSRSGLACLVQARLEVPSRERARDTYGVILTGECQRWETLAVDEEATAAARARLAQERVKEYRQAQEPLNWWVNADIRGAFTE